MNLKKTSRYITNMNMPLSRLLSKAGHFCILSFAMMHCTQVLASEYTPPDLYNIDYYQLPNGMTVLLKERHQTKTVSYRMVVNIGMVDYPCGRKETPHFLEHLLISGTPKHTESEHNDLIEENGGEWNAFTGEDETIYQIDIFSKHAALGLETLREIVANSQITQENVNKSRDIIHRESGGRPSIVKQWLNNLGVGIPGIEFAHQKLLEGTSYVCREFQTADDINNSDLSEAKDLYYVASNMALIVVGDFDSAEMKKSIELAFVEMKSGERNHRTTQIPNPISTGPTFNGNMSPLIGNEALVGVAYASGGRQSPDYFPRLFIEKYLADRLFKKLRVEEGISYSPSVDRISYSNTDIWFAYADSELSEIEKTVGLIRQEIERLVISGVSEELLSAVKNKLLTSMAQEFGSNRKIAHYYTNSLREIQKFGALIRKEEKINALSAGDIQRVAAQIFGETPPIVFHNTPTLTYTQLIAILGVFVLCVGYFIFRNLSWRGLS